MKLVKWGVYNDRYGLAKGRKQQIHLLVSNQRVLPVYVSLCGYRLYHDEVRKPNDKEVRCRMCLKRLEALKGLETE